MQFGYMFFSLTIILLIVFFIQKRKDKRISEYAILTIPVITYYLIISKTAPYLEQRYILPTLPIIVTGIVLLISYYIDKISKKKIKNILNIASILMVVSLQLYGIITKQPDYLYKGYNEYINLAKEYQNYQFIYVGINNYNHIKNLPEFTIYKESLILNETQLYLLQERNVENSFVVGIKSYLDVSNVLNEILKYTGAEEYELILEGKTGGFEANYYLITRN